MKETNYFSHDYGARNDPKLLRLQMDMGGLGLGIWWCLVEMLWEQGGFIDKNYGTIAFSLRWANEEDVQRVVEDYDLFECDGGRIWNKSALARIQKVENMLEQKREAGRASGERRRKATQEKGVLNECSTDAERVLNECSTDAEQLNKIKLNKIKLNNNSSSCACTRTREGEEKEEIFKIFLFERNFKKPEYELKRFWNYYEGRGWMWGEQEIVSKEAVARGWKPEEPGIAYPPEFLGWVKTVYEAARMDAVLEQHADGLLHNIEKATISGSVMTVWMKTKEWAQRLRDAGKYVTCIFRVDYRFLKS